MKTPVLFQDPDGDPDELTLGAFIALMVLCLVALVELWRGHSVNLQDFGVGAAAIVTAVAGGKRFRDGARPRDDDGPNSKIE